MPLWPATLAACVIVVGMLAGAAALNTAMQSRRQAVAEAELETRGAELPRRISVVEAELARTGARPPWAGRWYVGDGLGLNVTLWLAPESGCVARWTGCLGLYGANWGSVREQDGVLHVAFELPNDAVGEFPDAYAFGGTGDERYLRCVSQPVRVWTFHEQRDGVEPR